MYENVYMDGHQQYILSHHVWLSSQTRIFESSSIHTQLPLTMRKIRGKKNLKSLTVWCKKEKDSI